MYLFEAHFSNGEVYQQNADDRSITTETRNCFYDILQRIDEVEIFGLFPTDPNNRITYGIDLRDGHFEIAGHPFTAQDPSVDVPEDAKRRLIYFKRHRRTALPSGEYIDHPPEYHIGYQTNLGNGKNYQQTISVQ